MTSISNFDNNINFLSQYNLLNESKNKNFLVLKNGRLALVSRADYKKDKENYNQAALISKIKEIIEKKENLPIANLNVEQRKNLENNLKYLKDQTEILEKKVQKSSAKTEFAHSTRSPLFSALEEYIRDKLGPEFTFYASRDEESIKNRLRHFLDVDFDKEILMLDIDNELGGSDWLALFYNVHNNLLLGSFAGRSTPTSIINLYNSEVIFTKNELESSEGKEKKLIKKHTNEINAILEEYRKNILPESLSDE